MCEKEAIRKLSDEDVEKLIKVLVDEGWLETTLKTAFYKSDQLEFDEETEVSLRRLHFQYIISDQASDNTRNIFIITERKDEAYAFFDLLRALLRFSKPY